MDHREHWSELSALSDIAKALGATPTTQHRRALIRAIADAVAQGGGVFSGGLSEDTLWTGDSYDGTLTISSAINPSDLLFLYVWQDDTNTRNVLVGRPNETDISFGNVRYSSFTSAAFFVVTLILTGPLTYNINSGYFSISGFTGSPLIGYGSCLDLRLLKLNRVKLSR